MTPIGSNFVLPLVKQKRKLIRPNCYKLVQWYLTMFVYIWATGHTHRASSGYYYETDRGKLKNQFEM